MKLVLKIGGKSNYNERNTYCVYVILLRVYRSIFATQFQKYRMLMFAIQRNCANTQFTEYKT